MKQGSTLPAMHIACAADEAYAPHCAAMLHSLLMHNKPSQVHIHFLHGPALAADVMSRLQRLVTGMGADIGFHEIADSVVAGLPVMERIPALMWYRVLLPDLLPQLDRILYLDADTLIVDELGPLWEIDLGKDYLGAVANVFDPKLLHRPRELGLRAATDYFNSGVLLLNLAELRVGDCARRIFECARGQHGGLMWPDQDALNVVLAGKWRVLHPRWNCQNSLFYFPARCLVVFGAEATKQAREHPAILHFEGPGFAKPWHDLSKHPRRGEYQLHRAQTPWPPAPLEGVHWKNRFFRLLPMWIMPHAIQVADRLKHALMRVVKIISSPVKNS